MKQTEQQTLDGQIMVIVLLVLSILGIFVIAVASNTRRDVEEQERNEKYEQYLSLTERRLLQTIEQVQLKDTIDIADLRSALGSECAVSPPNALGQTIITCSDIPEEGSLDDVGIRLTVIDDNEVVDLPVEKDESLKINLDEDSNPITQNYNGIITMKWSGNAAWNITIEYVDATGAYRVAKDVYDAAGIYTSSITNHIFFFQPVTESGVQIPVSNATSFNLSTVTGLPAGAKLTGLRLKPVMKSGDLVTELTLSGSGSLPPQVRRLIGEGSSSQSAATGDESPTAVLEVQIPLHPVPAEVLDYVLRSEDTVSK